MDLGFQRQLSSILVKLPKQRRTGLFSATQTEAVEELARSGMRNPVKVEITQSEKQMVRSITPEGLRVEVSSVLKFNFDSYFVRFLIFLVKFTICPMENRPSQVAHFLSSNRDSKVILYVVKIKLVYTIFLNK